MCRQLAAVDRHIGAHDLLDKGVAGLGLNCDAAPSYDNVSGVPNEARVADVFAIVSSKRMF